MGPLVRTERLETLAVFTWAEACCSAEVAERVFRGGVADILEAARLLLPAIIVKLDR